MDRFVIVTPMKNEGPFILEWVAHNLAIGADVIAVYSNDCTDGSDALLDRLAAMGRLHHFDNSSKRPAPQRRAYRRFLKSGLAAPEDWVIPIDADEYINVKAGDHTLRALAAAVPEARTISMTWRLFGNGGVVTYEDGFLTDQFTRAAADIGIPGRSTLIIDAHANKRAFCVTAQGGVRGVGGWVTHRQGGEQPKAKG